MAEESIFTKIINGTIPSEILYHDDLVTAFKDINPKAQHHILIVTNKQIPTVSDVEDCDEQMLGHLFLVAKKIAKDLGVRVWLPLNRQLRPRWRSRSATHPHALISRWQVRWFRLPRQAVV